jgi:predicted secreted protein
MNCKIASCWISRLALIVSGLAAAGCPGRTGEPAVTPQGEGTVEPDGTVTAPEDTGAVPVVTDAPIEATDVEGPSYTEAQDGTSVTAAAGSHFTVALAENGTTGYQWVMELSPGLTLVSDDFRMDPGSEGRVGAGGTHYWTIEAATAGTQTIAGHYRRSWEEPPVDAQTFSLTVEVP